MMRYPQVIKYVGKLIYERGLDYYNEKKILTFHREKNHIDARVFGSANNEYSVTVDLDENGDVKEAHCSCPYWQRCKHVAAVLIHAFSDNEGRPDEESPPPFPVVGAKTEKIIQLDYSKEPSRDLAHNLRQIEEKMSPGHSDDGKEWRLVFKIKKNPDASGQPVEWFITPGIRLLKKDGTPGNVYNYRKKKCITYSSIEEKLLQRLLNKPGYKDDFVHYLETLIDNDGIPLVVQHGYETHEIQRHVIKTTHLEFEIQEIQQLDAFFSPVLTFHYGDGMNRTVTPADGAVLNDGSVCAVLSYDGSLLYKKNNGIYAAIITHIFTFDKLYTPSDIASLGDFIKTKAPDDITVSFHSQQINLVSHTPKPVLEINPFLHNRMTIALLFDYAGNIIEYSKDDGFIIHKSRGKEITVLRKDRITERDIFERLKTFFREYAAGWQYPQHQGEIYLEIDISTFLSRFSEELIREGYMIRIGRGKILKRGGGTFRLDVSSGIDWFDISLLYTDEEGHSHTAVLDINDIKQGLVEAGGSYILLDADNMEKVKLLFRSCRLEKGILRSQKLNFSAIDILYEEIASSGDGTIEKFRTIYEKLKNITAIPDYRLPEQFRCTLRQYQRAGYNWLSFLEEVGINGCLADDMGLGKTVQTLALIMRLKEAENLGQCLIVVPVSTLANWESEIERFTPALSCIRHAGQGRATSIDDISGYDCVLVSYHTLRNDIEIFSEKTFHYLILDESQNIKNANTKTFKAVRSIKSDHRLSLTGTPVENNTLELWAQMEFLNPGILGSQKTFKNHYTVPIEEYRDRSASAELKKRIFPFILRRKKEDVVRELPEKEIIYRFLEMGTLQREAYCEVNTIYREKINAAIDRKGVKRSAIEIIEAMLRLRQISLFPFLVSEKYGNIESCKFEFFKEMIQEILTEDHKILVFSQFVQVLKQLEAYVSGSDIDYAYIDGSTKKRKKEIERFQKDPDVRVFLLSLKAGGLGINLTAADYVILFDPWWNPAIEQQAIDRTHRIGQTQKVIAYKLIVKGSIEEKVIELQRKKEKLIRSVIADDKSIFKSFNKEDIMMFFK
ncbi:MAG: DEAD/DEAH box helicase family protein [Spirochaetales bacterium]|nr:DEAD/DEAH box helicase family protein [Spirochaetales bacterium]